MTTDLTFNTSDFYDFEDLLADDERALRHRVREFMTREVAPRRQRPLEPRELFFEVVPGSAGLGIALPGPRRPSPRRP